MKSRFRRHRWSGFFLLLLLLASCTFNPSLKKTESETDSLQETSRLEKLSREHPQSSVRVQSHLQLALLYVDAKNPRHNYSRALEELKIYLSLTPAEYHTADLQNWVAALKEMDHLRTDKVELEERNRTLQAQNDRLQASIEKGQELNRSLRDEATNLKETNHKMRETIEKLNVLDRQIEEKRRLMK